MNARDELRREMTHNHLYMDDERADELIDAYAHELAEQQRADATLREIEDETELAAYGRELADLIDPQAQPGQVRVTLDNRDAKFTPTVPRTPYFEDDDAQPNKPRSST